MFATVHLNLDRRTFARASVKSVQENSVLYQLMCIFCYEI